MNNSLLCIGGPLDGKIYSCPDKSFVVHDPAQPLGELAWRKVLYTRRAFVSELGAYTEVFALDDLKGDEILAALIKGYATKQEVAELRFEIEILRQWGNKDCTAMADEHIKSLRHEKNARKALSKIPV